MFNLKETQDKETLSRQKSDVFTSFIYRAPNPLNHLTLQRLHPSISKESMQRILETLISDGKIKHKQVDNPLVNGREIQVYTLISPENYPIRETFNIGGVEFKRWVTGD